MCSIHDGQIAQGYFTTLKSRQKSSEFKKSIAVCPWVIFAAIKAQILPLKKEAGEIAIFHIISTDIQITILSTFQRLFQSPKTLALGWH